MSISLLSLGNKKVLIIATNQTKLNKTAVSWFFKISKIIYPAIVSLLTINRVTGGNSYFQSLPSLSLDTGQASNSTTASL